MAHSAQRSTADDARSFDIKRERRDLYSGRVGRFDLVDVPPMRFLMVDGHGDPNYAPAYRAAVQSLYSVSYAIRAVAKAELEQVHTVGPLEGLWYADDPAVFTSRAKESWRWTMMIWQPDWITSEIIAAGMDRTATTKPRGTRSQIRCAELSEGPAIQTLHVGSYDDEGPVIAQLHEAVIPAHLASPSGPHHEIYLSDPRRIEATKLRTILRQPVNLT